MNWNKSNFERKYYTTSMHGQEKGPKCLCQSRNRKSPMMPKRNDARKEKKKFRTVPSICYLLLAVLKEIILPYKLTNNNNDEILDMFYKRAEF